ncbi:hypothetical protein WJ59_31350 [Burkholderia gladioli]|nr:hypothetical protein [Burkholderia gladioli]KVM59759.1 hypothetical protein WJ59_31350 [Burkholderia gladioli]
MPTLNFDDPLYLCVGGRLRGELRDADMSSFIETVRIDPRSNVPSESCSYVRETLACKIESGLETRYFFLLESDADDQ